MRILFLILIASITSNQGYSQNPIKQEISPNAASFLQADANKTDLFTGTPLIEVPLYKTDVYGYQLDLRLTYNSNGIKVAQASSNVGLGWNLSAGGSIVRRLNGIADEGLNFTNILATQYARHGINNMQTYYPNSISPRNIDLGYWQTIAAGNYNAVQISQLLFEPIFFQKLSADFRMSQQMVDTEPDIFEFSFNGKSGKFVFDNDNGVISIHQIPWMGLRIEYEVEEMPDHPKINKFIITDTDKSKYYFEANEITAHYCHVHSVSLMDSYDEDFGLVTGLYDVGGLQLNLYSSAWNLTKVVTPNNQEILYEYVEENLTTNPEGLHAKSKYLKYKNSPNQTIYNELLKVTDQTNIYQDTKRLSTIRSDRFRIEFIPEVNKLEENRPSAVKEIKVYNYVNDLVEKIGFEYGFSESDGIATATDRKDYVRLILKEIKHFGKSSLPGKYHSHKFFYNLLGFGTGATMKLPNARSFSVDQWGYYNGKQNNDLVPKIFVYPDLSLDNRRFRVERLGNYFGRMFEFDGADRIPDAAFMSVGMLNRIEYPTGGSAAYEFEPNEYLDEGEVFLGPGLRVKKISVNKGEGDEIFLFNYKDSNNITSGRIFAKPCMAKTIAFYKGVSNNLAYYQNTLARYGSHQPEIYTLDSRLLGYGKVTEIRPGNGSVVSTFSMNGYVGSESDLSESSGGDCHVTNPGEYCDGLFQRTPVTSIMFGSYMTDSSAFDLYPPMPGTSPFVPNPNYDWNRGLLLTKTFFTEAKIKLKSIINEYEIYAPGVRHNQRIPYDIYGIKFAALQIGNPNVNPDPIHDYVSGVALRVAKYRIITDVVKQIAAKTEVQFLNDQEILRERTEYAYESRYHPFVTKVSTTNSNGKEAVTEYIYPDDLWNADDPEKEIYVDMEAANLISPPIIIRQKVGNGYVKELFNQYENSNGVFLKKAIFEKAGLDIVPGSIEHLKVVINKFDSKGNIQQYTDASGVPTTILWSYDYHYPVLKAVGATLDEIIEADLEYYDLYYDEEGEVPDEEEFLRTYFANRAFITTYTYEALVGMKSETDHNGIITHYEYDDFGRLSYVKDNNHKIIRRICYNYAGQPEPCKLYYNQQKSKVFTRNNCGTGYQGGSYTYSVPANTYVGSSQLEADQLATADINTNGQAQANIHGTCTQVFSNVDVSGYYYNQNCPPGTATAFYVSMPGGFYTSTVDQTTANNLAIQAAQNWANLYGGCAGITQDIYATNGAGPYSGFMLVLTSEVNWQEQYYFYVGPGDAQQHLGAVTPGSYTVEIYPDYMDSYTSQICSYYYSYGSGITTFYNVVLDSYCSYFDFY